MARSQNMTVLGTKQRRSAWFAFALSAGLTVGAAFGQAQSSTSGLELVRAGATAVDRGDYADGAKRLTSAITSDKLSSDEMSKALYFRGIANRQLGRLGEAVSDFNGALWLKGLTTNQRAQAKLYLGLAYRSAGLGDQAKKALNEAKKLSPNDKRIASAIGGANVNPERSSGSTIRSFFGRDKTPEPEVKTAAAPTAPATPAAPAAPAAPGAPAVGEGSPAEEKPTGSRIRSFFSRDKTPEPDAGEATAEKSPAEVEIPDFRTTIAPAETAPEPAPAKKQPLRKAAREAPRPAESDWSTSVAPEPEAAREVASLDAAPPQPEEKGRIGRFFSSILDSSDEDEAANTPPSADEQAPPAADWAKSTRVEEFTEPAATSGAKRTYRVQLASSRSEKEARAYWGRLTSQYASVLGGRDPVIEKTDLGTLGTFYRLQVGPFDEKQEPLRLCNDFKRNGLDCFLVAR